MTHFSALPRTPKPDWVLVTEDQVFSFARDTLKSVWAVELVVVLQREPSRAWDVDSLILELRSSETVIVPCLATLKSAGLVEEQDGGLFQFKPQNKELKAIATELARIYAAKPMALAKAIMRAPNEKLSIFSNAFRIKD